LGARKAIDETTAAMANSFALCGFRFHRIGSSNMGLDQRKCPLETFAEPTGLLACARFFSQAYPCSPIHKTLFPACPNGN
jgi:hypothetical protein